MGYYDDVQKLPEQSVLNIQKFIDEKRKLLKKSEEFVNPILREDIFDLLSK